MLGSVEVGKILSVMIANVSGGGGEGHGGAGVQPAATQPEHGPPGCRPLCPALAAPQSSKLLYVVSPVSALS